MPPPPIVAGIAAFCPLADSTGVHRVTVWTPSCCGSGVDPMPSCRCCGGTREALFAAVALDHPLTPCAPVSRAHRPACHRARCLPPAARHPSRHGCARRGWGAPRTGQGGRMAHRGPPSPVPPLIPLGLPHIAFLPFAGHFFRPGLRWPPRHLHTCETGVEMAGAVARLP